MIIRLFLCTHLFDNPAIAISHNFTIFFQMLKAIIDRLINVVDKIVDYNNLLDIEGEIKPTLTSFKKQAAEL